MPSFTCEICDGTFDGEIHQADCADGDPAHCPDCTKEQTYKCYLCGEEIEWENPHNHHGNIFICEKCDQPFCTLCAEQDGGTCGAEDERVLCPCCAKEETR